MSRLLTILILGVALIWLLLRFFGQGSRKKVTQSRDKSSPLEGKKIIDAEFEDLDQDNKK